MARANRNLIGITNASEAAGVHEAYRNGLDPDEFSSGFLSLAAVFKSLYTGMVHQPQHYAMKDADDVKGLVKNTNFLLLLAQKGALNGGSLEVDGKTLAAALKEAKVTKPEQYFKIIEPLGFTTSGLGKKIETSDKIAVEFPDNRHLLTALKAIADAVGAFSAVNTNQGNSYFELLDQRVLEKYPATEPKRSMEYVISKLNRESRDAAERFYEFIKPLAKCEIKGNPIQYYWTVTFSLKSTKKVILSLKLNLESHEVKLNLANIGKYMDHVSGLPARLLREIRDGGWGCSGDNCNPKCERGFAFDLDGVSYKKCRCGSFVFDNPDKNDSELLLGLLKKELEFTRVADGPA